MQAPMQKKSNNRSLTLYVVFSISIAVVYSIVEFIFSTITGVSHDTLTTCVYAFFTGEIVTTGLIRIFKFRENNNEQ